MIGPHILTPTTSAMAWVRKAGIVKAVDNPHVLRDAPPGAITIFRSYFDPYEQAAASVILTVDKICNQLGDVRPTYVELFNEWAQTSPDEIRRHLDFTRACTEIMHQRGHKVAGFSFSTGNPDLSEWLLLRDEGFGGADVIAIHEYWAKQGFSTWNALRYRRVHELLGGQHLPFVITECGRDAIWQEGGDKQPGWKLQGVSAEQYLAELLAYDAEISRDDYVLGATVFTAGPTPDWAAFSTDEFSDGIPAWDGQQGDVEMWDRHQVFDEWYRRFGGDGFNPNDAFGQYISAHPEIDFGMAVSGIREDVTSAGRKIYYRQHSVCILTVFENDWANVTVATNEAELPLA